MLRIRLRKPGKSVKGRRHFKIVVIEGSGARDTRFIEQIGYYNPTSKLLKFDIDKYQKWAKKGAKPTETVKALFKRYKKTKQAAA